MAEVKNAFIKSKMNKDLDARLIPQGEYRDAVNIQVSKSEGDDVGALENVLGNFSLFDVVNDTGVPNLKCIGYFVDNSNSVVYLFFTNNDLTSYNPNGQNFIYSYNANSADLTLLVVGAYLNFSKNNPIIGVNLLEDFLFFTDNRNQPRKINVNLASTQGTGYYTNEDQISVAKYFPYQTIEVIKESTLPSAPPGSLETTMFDVASQFIPIDENASPNISNPYYDVSFPGDPQFLEDKFARFSYRFKFLDGEYSLIAPFTQPCFIPKQDGYFLQGDEGQTVISTVVEFMENKVNKIALQIPSPRKTDGNAATSAELNTYFHISEIDILYKESESLALQVVETLKVSEITVVNNFFEYIYNSTKPYRTLPEKEITRVYDKVPVKALGQEIISNRVVYSNFQDKHTPPSGIKYQVGANEKYEEGDTYSSKTSIEYPNHSLKQNRNYQVGVVLSDRYGRQSTVILSNEVGAGTGVFGADTVYLPYRVSNDSISFLGDSLKIAFNETIDSTQNLTSLTPGLYDGLVNTVDYKPLGWYSYKIVVKQLEQEYYNVYLPSAMKGEPYWFNGNPPTPTPTLPRDQNASYVILLNDNINKIPRDLKEVGAQDRQFRSSVRLFGRVENTVGSFSNIGNAQFFPGRNDFTVNQIEDLFDAFDTSGFIGEGNTDVIPITSSFNPYYAFLRSESNPFMAEFVTSQTPDDQFGVVNPGWITQGSPPLTIYEVFNNLAILETKPTVSRLDLFYETSTSDLISNLNQAINEGGGSGNAAADIVDFNYNHDESDAPGTDISGTFYFVNFVGTKLTSAIATLNSVFDDTGSGVDLSGQFYLDDTLSNGDFILRTASVADGKPADAYFYYGSNPLPRQYTFSFNVTSGGTTNTKVVTGNLANVVPTINNSNVSPINASTGQSIIIGVLDGVNGSNTSNPTTSTYTQELTWSVTTLGGNAAFGISADGTEVLNSNASAAGTSTFELNLQDAGGANATPKTFTVFFGQPQIPTDLNAISKTLGDGDGYAIWFTDNTSSLSTNPPDFGNASTSLNYLNGFEAPGSLSSTVTKDVCPTSTTFNAEFENVTKSTGLTQGTFYVVVRGINTNKPSSFGKTGVFSRYAVQYRATQTDAWQSVADFNNTSISGTNVGGTWQYAQGTPTIEGFYNGSGDFLTAEVDSTYPNPFIFGISQKVLAFDEIGEYRIVYGNLASNFGEFQFSVNCTQAGAQDLQVNGRIQVGDFYYPQPEWYGDNDGVYEYRVASNNSCSNLFSSNGTAYYAAEPFAKYVTQLFTDTLLLTPANLTGTFRFRRMETRGSSTVSNSELTKDGAYTANFTSGLKTSVPSPCLYT